MTSPWIDGRVVVVLPAPFSLLTSAPWMKLTRLAARPVLVVLNVASAVPDRVSMLRLTAWLPLHAPATFPWRRISAAPPFSTCGPSGKSEYGLTPSGAQAPAGSGLMPRPLQ